MRRLLLASFLAVLGAGCSAPRFGANAHYSRLSLDGDVGVQAGNVEAQNSVLDLGLDDAEGSFGARADVKWSSPHLSLSYERGSFSGRGTTSAEISEGGVVIPADTDVDSDLDLEVVAAALTFDLLPTDAFELGLGLGVTGLGFDGTIREIGGAGERVEASEFAPLPVLALRGAIRLGRFDASALLSATRVGYDGDRFEVLDLDLRARYELTSIADVVFGWRDVSAEVEYDDDDTNVDLDVRLSGPYIGFGVRF